MRGDGDQTLLRARLGLAVLQVQLFERGDGGHSLLRARLDLRGYKGTWGVSVYERVSVTESVRQSI